MATTDSPRSGQLKKELFVFGALFAASLLLLPASVYIVGKWVFGEYGGGDFFDFFVALQARLLAFEPAAWFLVLSPWLLWQLLRFTWLTFRGRGPLSGR